MTIKGIENAAARVSTAPAWEHTIATVRVQAGNSNSAWQSSDS